MKASSVEEFEDDAKQIVNRRALKPGEWACVDAKCAHINIEKRTSCDVCGKSKPKAKSRVGREIGKDAAEKSKGLFAAEDWVCTKCGNVNWARRSICNVCNAPKLGDLEMRTGYGGGYMDREDVEYIQRDDDDEEFDEFGRKKKKRKMGSEEISQIVDNSEKPKQIKDEENQEDEENEEESDEADLDKYDLTAELLNFKVDVSKIKAAAAIKDKEEAGSTMSSDCSCSCSGGECSCVESDEEPVKKSKRNDESKRRSSERERNGRSRDSQSKDSRDEDYKRREHRSSREHRELDRGSNRTSGRDRERRRSRDSDRRYR